ncbi:MAG TPA: tRNA (adenosine(37)-N6)-dimethylallyltransferase MiaA [Burkholderiaceae bacterium]|nr:tRNA (adenosine(37)-N6)-dimethylallyltransferase MiaA [Burkholderiaceae bacterium]
MTAARTGRPGAPASALRAAVGKQAVALLGATASGKSAAALQLARELPLEIVSVDSAQVYRGLDVGTAKPSVAERARVAHHLIDLRDPAQAYCAAQFVQDARAAIAAIRARGRLPLLVGGTMLYARALREGLAELPPADADVRERLAQQAAELGWPALYARLQAIDPRTAARLSPADSQRIQRALEVYELAGEPLSDLLQASAPDPTPFVTIAWMPPDRAQLNQPIQRRFDAMLAAGFLDEVRALRDRGDLNPGLPSVRSVGYRQAWAHLDGQCSYDEFYSAAIGASRQLAKRQFTWLRSMSDAIVIDPRSANAFDQLRRAVADWSG